VVTYHNPDTEIAPSNIHQEKCPKNGPVMQRNIPDLEHVGMCVGYYVVYPCLSIVTYFMFLNTFSAYLLLVNIQPRSHTVLCWTYTLQPSSKLSIFHTFPIFTEVLRSPHLSNWSVTLAMSSPYGS
jgi:hypothetical protein